MAEIFNFNFNPPTETRTDSFVLFMTDIEFAASDYDAVMSSRDSLRIWSQSPWPEDDFSLEQNREDLAHHVQDNLDHLAFGYMIYSPDLSTCYGSLYINPLRSVRENYEVPKELLNSIESFDARIDYWTVDRISPELQSEILTEVQNWFRAQWKIRPLFSARREMTERIALYTRAGLRLIANLQSQNSAATLLLFS